ncbi:MAG: DUF3524 domain-containing protein [Chitinophagales bacterium]|nr:DUF3524 domain-containing protein [Chitinophagales bacterium]MDW8418627.1 DUF3524 domain-containing protein [Chitinophagales bacterium]
MMASRLHILLVEPFFTGSHRAWAEGYRKHSRHNVQILSLPGYHWKWRMHGGAVTLAGKALQTNRPDVALATDMLDLALFKALTYPAWGKVPMAVYFHENQLTYPWSPADKDVALQRDNHYAFINYTAALAADRVFFNSRYHHDSFLEELPRFLNQFPDHQNIETIQAIRAKSAVLPLGLDLKTFDPFILPPEQKGKLRERAVILWNHRWEYDKNPEAFFNALMEIAERGIDFRLIVLGEQKERRPAVFDVAREKLADKILHFGYVESREEYARWVCRADILPVTSYQDFFGSSVVEAMYCNVVPFLPRRLAYPEHIPETLHRTFFYDEEDFVNKLQRRIWDVKYLRIMNTQPYAARYDWSNMASHYDRALEELCAK